ncbi:MAG: hypothetical protein AAGB04_31770, partial [Pseudomonadota bacterium]
MIQSNNCREARNLRGSARDAIKIKEYAAATRSILEAISKNPAIRNGAQLLAEAKNGEVEHCGSIALKQVETAELQELEHA